MTDVNYKALFEDYVTAYRHLFGVAPSKAAVLAMAAPAEFETNSGRAWPGTNNFGAVDLRALTPDELARYQKGELKVGDTIPGNPGGVLHVDTHPGPTGPVPYPVWFVTFPTELEGILYYLGVLIGHNEAAKAAVDAGDTTALALAMYLHCYFEGRHAGARPCGKRSQPLNAAEKANVGDYASALSAITTSGALGVAWRAWDYQDVPPADPAPPTLATPPPKTATAFGLAVAALATSRSGCSDDTNQPKWIDAVVRPVDQSAPWLAYYTTGWPSTCGLFAAKLLLDEGFSDPELSGHYDRGNPGAVADTQTAAARHSILEAGTPSKDAPFGDGDIWILDDAAGEAHEGVCTGPARVNADGSWTVPTVEGGQLDSKGHSTAIQSFTRTFVWKDGKLFCGARWVIATIRCSQCKLPPATAAATAATPTAAATEPATSAATSDAPLATGAVTEGTVTAGTTTVTPRQAFVRSALTHLHALAMAILAGVATAAKDVGAFAKDHPLVTALIVLAFVLVAVELGLDWARRRRAAVAS